jgi:arsenite-transporting ATPase
MRILVFTGKGGTGKTTVSAATGLRCAENGKKTLMLSTDPAHSLSDAVGINLGDHTPKKIRENLYGLEIDSQRLMEEKWEVVLKYLTQLFTARGFDQALASEMVVIPGMDELFSLLTIRQYINEYDVIVLDTAPTGHTLRLMSFPEVLGSLGRNIVELEKIILEELKPLRMLLPVSLPGADVQKVTDSLIEEAMEVRELLVDPSVTTVKLVVNPEKMVLLESMRTLTFMNLFGFLVDGVVVNRLIPEEVSDPYFTRWKQQQADYMNQIDESFDPLPILRLPLFQEEIIGTELLHKVADALYHDKDPTDTLTTERPFQLVQQENGNYELIIKLPFSEKGELAIEHDRNTLVIRVATAVGKYKRVLYLPTVVRDLDIEKAKFHENELRILFVKG